MENLDFSFKSQTLNISTMKPITPATTLSPRSMVRGQVDMAVLKGNMRFLAHHHNRVFPLNIVGEKTQMESYWVRGEQGRSERREEQKTRRRVKSRPTASMYSKPEDPEAPKLPRLSIQQIQRHGRTSSTDYQDYIIGGNSYNAEVTQKLYHPQTIHVSNRSKFRLHFLRPTPKQLSTSAQPSSPHRKKSPETQEKQTISPTIPHRRTETVDQSANIVYPRPALTFPEKLYRIKRLVDTTLSLS